MNVPAVYNIMNYLRTRLNVRRKLPNEPPTNAQFSNLTATIDQLKKENSSLNFKNELLRYEIELMTPIVKIIESCVETGELPPFYQLHKLVGIWSQGGVSMKEEEDPLWV